VAALTLLVCTPAALVCSPVVVAPAGAAATGAALATPPLLTSLLSPRRLPDWLEDAAAHTRLAATVASVLTPAALGPAATSTCAVVMQGNQVLASSDPTMALIPASNMKVLTATAALDKLGPNFVYTTQVMGAAAPAGGVLTGNLYLVGSGDPMLRTQPYVSSLPYEEPDYTSLTQLAAQVVAAGVTTITGSVVGDATLFDDQLAVPTWSSTYGEDGNVGPLSALDVNDGFVLTNGYYEAARDPADSAAQQFATLLAADGVNFPAAVTTPTPSTAPPPTTPVTPPAGTLINGSGATETTTVLPAAAGPTPVGSVQITSINSPPLSNIIQTILRASDDTGAELVTKELGARFDDAGTTQAGVAVIRADLAADGLPASQYTANDGSGLDRGDHVTCQLVADDLAREGSGSVLAAGLPVSGKTGTLSDRLTGQATVGRILAKTGTLDGVSALSGFVLPNPLVTVPDAQLGVPLTFSLIMNGLADSDTGVDVADALATALAAYPDVPPLAAITPLGVAPTTPTTTTVPPPTTAVLPTVPPTTVAPTTTGTGIPVITVPVTTAGAATTAPPTTAAAPTIAAPATTAAPPAITSPAVPASPTTAAPAVSAPAAPATAAVP
jgi:serine-type D-Ala-D-Ala carboxypeptidase/endopeptidase (penicillin-binding protein 4)